MIPARKPTFAVGTASAATGEDQLAERLRRLSGFHGVATPYHAPMEDADEQLLTPAQASQYLSVPVADVNQMIQAGQVLVHHSAEGPRLPGFQFAGSQLNPNVSWIISQLSTVCAVPETVYLWFFCPKDELGGATPAEWLSAAGASDALRLAIERDVARLS